MFPVRYGLNPYINLLRNSVFKGLNKMQIYFREAEEIGPHGHEQKWKNYFHRMVGDQFRQLGLFTDRVVTMELTIDQDHFRIHT
jgi:hypothetical protein